MEIFNDNDKKDPRFMLCSQRAAGECTSRVVGRYYIQIAITEPYCFTGVGVTLTRANVVFIMSPWWNDADETQCMDRCHRIGTLGLASLVSR